MSPNRIKRIKVILIFTLVLLSLFCFVFYVNGMTEQTTDEANSNSNDSSVSVNLSTIHQENQENVTNQIADILQNTEYTEENPYVLTNPYGTSPLSAVVLFQTSEKATVSFEIEGKTEETSITQSFTEMTTSHEIPILGLYSDTTNYVTLTTTFESGKSITKKFEITTDALPDTIGQVDIETRDTEKMALKDNELTFAIPSTKLSYGYDVDGDIRWYSTLYNSHIFKELANGHLLFLTKESNDASTYNVLLETDYLGKVYRSYELSSNGAVKEDTKSEESTVIHHDAIELPNGNLLLTINDGSDYVEDTMIEIDRETGSIEKTIDLKDILPETFYTDYESTTRDDGKIDWFHQNAIDYDEADNSIIISGRNQDTVMKLDYETLEIKWILADATDWPEEYQQYLLTGIEKYPAGQHAPIVLPDQDGNPDTLDILLYDNNVVVTRGDESESTKYSQAVQYRIDETNQTIEKIWDYGESLGSDYFTNIIGSARYLSENGNRLVNFGFLENGQASSVIEVTEDNEVVFQANVTDFRTSAWLYRSERFSLYPTN